MYKLVVESPQFHGKSLVNQHKLVTKVRLVIIIIYICDVSIVTLCSNVFGYSKQVLEKEIGEMHGLTIQTRKPPKKP